MLDPYDTPGLYEFAEPDGMPALEPVPGFSGAAPHAVAPGGPQHAAELLQQVLRLTHLVRSGTSDPISYFSRSLSECTGPPSSPTHILLVLVQLHERVAAGGAPAAAARDRYRSPSPASSEDSCAAEFEPDELVASPPRPAAADPPQRSYSPTAEEVSIGPSLFRTWRRFASSF